MIKKITNEGETSSPKKRVLKGLQAIFGSGLKRKYMGTPLSVVSMDAKNEVFSIAFTIVKSENKHSWAWFF